MFVTFIIIIIMWLIPFCQIIDILLYSHVYRDTRAYILDPCIREFLYLGCYQICKNYGGYRKLAFLNNFWPIAELSALKALTLHYLIRVHVRLFILAKKSCLYKAYLMYFWAVFGNFISKICIHEEQICHPVRLFYPVPVCDSVE